MNKRPEPLWIYEIRRMAINRFLIRFMDDYRQIIKRSEIPYVDAVVRLVMNDPDKYIEGADIGFRNHERNKSNKLIKVEAYYLT